jgi:hypothetical protein
MRMVRSRETAPARCLVKLLVSKVRVTRSQATRPSPRFRRLHGYNGDAGAVIYPGGGVNEVVAGTHDYVVSSYINAAPSYNSGGVIVIPPSTREQRVLVRVKSAQRHRKN